MSTGVMGLDAVLDGGLLCRGVYMLRGKPGAGKTIVANQIGFHHAAQGGRVVYVTLLAETHERILFNLEPLTFFDAARVPEQVAYVSAYSIMEETGFKGLAEFLRREARARKATLLVVDGLTAFGGIGTTGQDFKKFIHELQILDNLLGCTTLLLASESSEVALSEQTMVDGVIELTERRIARHAERELEVTKFRGSSYLRGGHAFAITDAGIAVYPRLEALLRNPQAEDNGGSARVSTGMATLDRALDGGLRRGSTAVVFGPTGVGKTTLGLHFLDAASASEPGLLFGFYEPPPRVLLKAQALGLDLAAKERDGTLEMIWHPPTEQSLDGLGHRLLAAVRARGVKRLFIDGVDGFLRAAVHPDRISHFFSALTHELRILGVTGMYTVELQSLFGLEVELPLQGISCLTENVFLLRYVERDARIRRVFAIVKARDSNYDSTVRELKITSTGATLGAPLPSGGHGAIDATSSSRTKNAAGARLLRVLLRRDGLS
jgi:circadian clock protein KaiC